MSSDVDDDQVLPESLQKLEIVSVYAQSQTACKSNNERNQNPFYSELSRVNGIDDRVRQYCRERKQNKKKMFKNIHISNVFFLFQFIFSQCVHR